MVEQLEGLVQAGKILRWGVSNFDADDLDELRAFVDERVGGYKRPRGYEVRDELPRTDAGVIEQVAASIAKLLPEMVDFLQDAGYTRVAVSIDARSGDTLSELPRQVRDLEARGVNVRVLFLDAKTETLLKRFSETRRRHPLSTGGDLTVAECIEDAESVSILRDMGVHLGQGWHFGKPLVEPP